jgi:hypothetical protein
VTTSRRLAARDLAAGSATGRVGFTALGPGECQVQTLGTLTDQVIVWGTALALFRELRQAGQRELKERAMANYRMVYGDDEQVVRETFNDVELEREDGWLVIFRGNEAILRVREEHVRSIEEADGSA